MPLFSSRLPGPLEGRTGYQSRRCVCRAKLTAFHQIWRPEFVSVGKPLALYSGVRKKDLRNAVESKDPGFWSCSRRLRVVMPSLQLTRERLFDPEVL